MPPVRISKYQEGEFAQVGPNGILICVNCVNLWLIKTLRRLS